jgi:hypothetical protein
VGGVCCVRGERELMVAWCMIGVVLGDLVGWAICWCRNWSDERENPISNREPNELVVEGNEKEDNNKIVFS